MEIYFIMTLLESLFLDADKSPNRKRQQGIQKNRNKTTATMDNAHCQVLCFEESSKMLCMLYHMGSLS